LKTVIILGSANSDGDTKKVAQAVMDKTKCDLIDLNDYKIGYYDYEHKNRKDDFINLIKEILEKYDTIIFATPVYWYSMSGILKVFFDRITDLITIEKELGRKFRGKSMAVITSSTGENLEDTFWQPFIRSADYLGMQYLGNTHTIAGEDNDELLDKFIQQFEEKNS